MSNPITPPLGGWKKRIEDVVYGVAITIVVPVSEAMLKFDDDVFSHPSAWVRGLVVACIIQGGSRLYDWNKRRKVPVLYSTVVPEETVQVAAKTGEAGDDMVAVLPKAEEPKP